MKLKCLRVFIIVLLSSIPILQLKADDTLVKSVFEKIADAALNEMRYVEKKYSAFLDDSITLTGVLHYRPPDTVIREQKTPERMRIEIKGNVVNIERNEDNRTVKLNGAPALQVFVDSLRAILAGDLESIKAHYNIEFSGKVSAWKMLLRPRDNNLGGYIDNIKFEGKQGFINKIEVHEDDENWSEMTLELISSASTSSLTGSHEQK